MSRIIKVDVGVRLRLITLIETLIILDIIETESNNCFIIHNWTNPFFLTSTWMFSKFVPTLCFRQVLSVFSLLHNQQTAPLPPSSTFLCFWVLVFNYFFDVLHSQWSKPRSHVFASSLMASNTKRANLTWLPLEIMHRGHTWHDYPWPWVSLTWLMYNLQPDNVPGANFENSLYALGQSEKR